MPAGPEEGAWVLVGGIGALAADIEFGDARDQPGTHPLQEATYSWEGQS